MYNVQCKEFPDYSQKRTDGCMYDGVRYWCIDKDWYLNGRFYHGEPHCKHLVIYVRDVK